MPNPRKPAAVAKATGADVQHPGRHAGRSEPKQEGPGPAPGHLDEDHAAVWDQLVSEFPWVRRSDRQLLEITTRLTVRMRTTPEMGVNALAQLRLCISSLGGTPVDVSKITQPEEEDDDPAAGYLN